MKKITLKGIIVKQKDKEMIVISPTVEQIRKLFYVFRKSRDNPEALQRKLSHRKVNEIDEIARNPGIYFPNAIVVNATDEDNVTVTPIQENVVEVTFRIPKVNNTESIEAIEGKIGFIIDGQHRIEGLKNHPDFQLPVVMFLYLDKDIAYKTFADINEKQDKVSKILLNYIKYEIGDYSDDDLTGKAFEYVLKLNDDQDSPLFNCIRMFEDDKRKWVTSPTLTRLIKTIIDIDGVLTNLTEADKLKIIKNYLAAWKELYPDAWTPETRTQYVLTKAMGITIMFNLFERIFHRCLLYENQRHTITAFKNQLSPLLDAEIIDGNETYPLDWSSNIFGKSSSGKGIRNLTKQIHYIIPPQGEPNL